MDMVGSEPNLLWPDHHLKVSLVPSITVQRIFGSPIAFLSVRLRGLVHVRPVQLRLVLLLPLHPPVLQQKPTSKRLKKVYSNRHGQEHDFEVIPDNLLHFATKLFCKTHAVQTAL